MKTKKAAPRNKKTGKVIHFSKRSFMAFGIVSLIALSTIGVLNKNIFGAKASQIGITISKCRYSAIAGRVTFRNTSNISYLANSTSDRTMRTLGPNGYQTFSNIYVNQGGSWATMYERTGAPISNQGISSSAPRCADYR